MTNNAVTLQQYWRGGAIAGFTAIVGLLALAAAAEAAPLEELQYDAQQEQVSFVLPDGVMPRSFLMAQPARIVIDIPDTQVGSLPPEQTFSSAVKRLEVTQVEPQLARLVLEMSPQATFARGQVNLQNVGDAAPGKDRWVAKLLLSKRPGSSASPAPLAERAAQPLPKPTIAVKPAPAVELPPGMEAVVGTEAAVGTAVPEVVVTAPVAPSPLPKLDSVPIPSTPGLTPPLPGTVPIARLPETPVSPSIPGLPPTPPLLGSVVDRPVGNSPAALVTPTPVIRPDLQPSQASPLPNRPIVSVPPLASLSGPVNGGVATGDAGSRGASLLPNLPPSPPLLGSALPPAPGAPIVPIRSPNAAGTSELPPLPQVSLRGESVNVASNIPVSAAPAAGLPGGMLPPIASSNPLPQANPLPQVQSPQVQPQVQLQVQPQVGVLPFGAQLPGRSPMLTATSLPGESPVGNPSGLVNTPGQAVVALDNLSTGGVMLSAGTTLSLRYDQPAAMKLNSGQRQQTLLSLLSPIVDSRGRVVVAQGSVVLGEFVTAAEGSQFTSQTVSLPNRSLSLASQSSVLPATKQISNDRLLQNSGIGALAGALLGGLNGSVLGGAAAGAAVTYAISPKQTIVQPGQTFQVQLTQNFFAVP
jgi:hypothetical protein